MNASPQQKIMATNALQRLLRLKRLEYSGDRWRSTTFTLPREEMECLAAVAAECLGMDAGAFDLGAFLAPGESPKTTPKTMKKEATR